MTTYLTILSAACLVLVTNAQFYPGYMGAGMGPGMGAGMGPGMGMRPPFPGFGPMAGVAAPQNPAQSTPPNPDTSAPTGTEVKTTESSVKLVADTLGNSCLRICEKTKLDTYRYEFDSVIDVMEIVRTVMDCPKWCSTAKDAFANGVITLEKLGQEL